MRLDYGWITKSDKAQLWVRKMSTKKNVIFLCKWFDWSDQIFFDCVVEGVFGSPNVLCLNLIY